jgi:hypothetical protein
VLIISGAVEGLTDEAVLKRLVEHVGAELGTLHGRRGKSYLTKKLQGFNSAARFAPWIVLMDLDDPSDCAPNLRKVLLPSPAKFMQFRIAVHEVEAWLLADKERFSSFFKVSKATIPDNPESLKDPKRALVDIIARSRSKSIRTDMIPRLGSGRPIGPAYASRLMQFASDRLQGWRPEVAATFSDSLRRCVQRLRECVGA